MKINRIRIKNLYSYENADLTLYDYNVISGTNASGKTNLLRVLNFIQANDSGSITSLENRRLDNKYKFDDSKPSSVILYLELSDYEACILMSHFFKQEFNIPQVSIAFKKISIGLFWTDTISNDSVAIPALRLGNGLTIIRHGNDWFCGVNEMPSDNPLDLLNAHKVVNGAAEEEFRRKYESKHGFLPYALLAQPIFVKKLLGNEDVTDFFKIEDSLIRIDRTIDDVRYESTLKKYQKDIFDFTGLNNRNTSQISFWYLLASIISHKIIIIRELRPHYNDLAKMIFELKTIDGNEMRESLLSTGFSKMFPQVSYDARQAPNNSQTLLRSNEPRITITENGKVRPIEESASGYFDVLYLLLNCVHAKDSMLILDEPALHLHPNKIKQLGLILKGLVNDAGNQALVITHSPYFVDYSTVAEQKTSAGLVYVKKQNDSSKIFFKPGDIQIELKPHLFKPEIFFSKCIILVEGAPDLAVLAAISEGFKNILEENDITIVDACGTGGIEKYIPLLEVYDISYVGMADHDYNGKRTEVIILDHDLEAELRKLGWDLEKKFKKVDAIVAYDLVLELMKTSEGKNKIKTMPFYNVLKTALVKTGFDLKNLN